MSEQTVYLIWENNTFDVAYELYGIYSSQEKADVVLKGLTSTSIIKYLMEERKIA